MSRLTLPTLVLCAAAIVGCARAIPSQFPIQNSNVITAEEIAQADASRAWNAYDLIAELRPAFLRSRGATSVRESVPTRAEIYLDGVHFGGLDSLKTISAAILKRIEYLGAMDATTRFGTNHVGGAILLSTH